MAFVETRFPTDIAYGAVGGPEYSTDIVEIASGHEQRNSNWSAARARYNVAHGVKTKEQLDALIAFFRARRGKAEGFRFKDWTDYQATYEAIGTGDGVTVLFQLKKRYSSSGVEQFRTIKKPVETSVNIYVDDVLQTSGVDVDYATGSVTFTAPPAMDASIHADFEFDVPVRFDTDRLSATIDTYGSHSWYDIPLLEIRL